jgi:dTMP kinase
MRGKFITVEGLDGAGKSTHLAWLSRFLEQRRVPLCVTREPGGTSLGDTLRALLLDGREPLHPETEALLMFAARREHLDKIIQPALAQGTWVLCDRFTDASFAYQGGGSGVAWDKLESLEKWVQGDLTPDLTLYFDVYPDVGRGRASAVKAPDRFERERESFHERTRAAYLRRAAESQGRVQIIDANCSIEAVQAQLERVMQRVCDSNALSAGTATGQS